MMCLVGTWKSLSVCKYLYQLAYLGALKLRFCVIQGPQAKTNNPKKGAMYTY